MSSASTGISASSTKWKIISTFCLRLPLDLSGACMIIFLSKELAIRLLCMGFPEFLRTKEHCDNKRRNWAIFSFIVGISAYIRGFL